MISFHCPECGIKLEVPEEMTGVSGPCPNCSATITAPEQSRVVTEDDGVNQVAKPQGNKRKGGSLFTVKKVMFALTLIAFNLIAAYFFLNKDNETEVSKPVAKAIKQMELESVGSTEVEKEANTKGLQPVVIEKEEKEANTKGLQPVVIEKEDGAVLIKVGARPSVGSEIGAEGVESEFTVEDILNENVKVDGQFEELQLPSELSE